MLRSKLLPTCCALALSMSACAENNTSLFIAGVLAGEPPECEYKADQASVQFPSGVLDVGITTTYTAEMLVALQLAPRGEKAKLRAETMFFQVRGAEVRVTTAAGALIDEFSVPAGGTVSPSSAATPGFGLTEVTLIHNDLGQRFRREVDVGDTQVIVAEVRVFGDTGGGAELTSGSYSFNIEVCHGCLRTFVENGARLEANGNVYCERQITEAFVGGGCKVGQDDGFYDCRRCVTDECYNAPL